MEQPQRFIRSHRVDGGGGLRRFQVLGERSSGTNVLHVTLKRHLQLEPTDVMGWKHGHPSPIAIPSDVLVVVVVRDPFRWARSMFSKPWHATPEIQALGFSEFIRAPWISTMDRARYFGTHRRDLRIGQPLQPDRHPITGRPFANIFEMRNVKTAVWLGMADRGCNFAMLRLETFQTDPAAVINDLSQGFDVVQTGAFRPVTRRLGARFKPSVEKRPDGPQEIRAQDRSFIRSQLDGVQERILGYDVSEHGT